jgi:Zn finger protein HypA/HybF involved in hydrogenase expression
MVSANREEYQSCPICFESISVGIYCNGCHQILCSTCRDKLTSCPFCRAEKLQVIDHLLTTYYRARTLGNKD